MSADYKPGAVVLDLAAIATPKEILSSEPGPEVVKCLRAAADAAGGWRAVVAYRIADQIEAQTKPPRIPEPGLWGVVEAALPRHPQRFHFVRTKFGWTNAGDGKGETLADYVWETLVDPVLVREGVES